MFHLLFEQSGTFKKELNKLGYQAKDYDILNDFGETDYQIDLFNEIEIAYTGGGKYIWQHNRRRPDNSVLSLCKIWSTNTISFPWWELWDERLGLCAKARV